MSTISESFISDGRYFKQIQNEFPNTFGTYLPDIFPLGYFVKRSEPRLLYVMPVTMHYDGREYAFKSKNISINGLQLYILRTNIEAGKTVKITFDKFVQTINSVVGGEDQFTPFSELEYHIKDVHHLGEKTYISLVQKNLPALTMDFLERFIVGNRSRYKVDATDRICASKAQYYGKLYTVNMQHVPMFILWNQKQGFYIDTMIKTNRNTHFFSYINQNGQSDYSAFCLPQRIKKFAELSQSNQSAIMFTYWENKQFYSVFDFELQSSTEIPHILAKVKACKGRIYKALTNLNKKPPIEKMMAMLSKIQKIDVTASKMLDKRTSESMAQVIFSDITPIFSRPGNFSDHLEFHPGEVLSLAVISNNNKQRMADAHVLEQYDKSLLQQPDIVSFNIDHHRYDPRYQYEMKVSVKYNNHIYSAQTIDFSRSGLGLIIQQQADIPEDCIIEITFSSLLLKGISTQLQDIKHRVMISRRKNAGLFLGVIRNTNECEHSINRFFTHLVKRNKDKLKLCVRNKVDSVIASFYEAFVTENIQTIPIVISRDKKNQHYVREIGLSDTPCGLAEKLYIEGHGYDFHFLTTVSRLKEFRRRTLKATDKNTQSFMIFLFKKSDKNGKSSIFSITDYELADDEQIEQFIHYTLNNAGSCVQIKFINDLLIDKLYRTMTLDKVEQLNKSSVKLLAQEYKEIIGFAEMLDLTDEYRKLYHP